MASKATKTAALPFPGVSEGFDLVKKVWGVAGLPTLPTPASMTQFAARLPQTLPSMIAPTLDVEELDKRIADLRAVEQWLNLNLSMLRTTVQSLEVQRNTIATLKSFGGAMLAGSAAGPGAAPPLPTFAAPPIPSPVAAPPPLPKAKPTSAKQMRRAAAATPVAALPLNPTAWWNTLQEQFTKIAAAAAAEAQAAAKAAATGETTGEKKLPAKARKPAARKRQRR